MIIFEFIKFVIFVILFFVIPGYGILKIFKIDFPTNIKFSVIIITGLCFFIYLAFIIRRFNFPFYLLYLFIVFDIWIILHLKSVQVYQTFFRFENKEILIKTLLLLSAVLLVISHLKSGYYNDGIHITGARDTLWRLSIATSLTQYFPPQNFGYAGSILNNYHYFYDLLIAAASKLLSINIFYLYTREFAVLSGFLFLCSLYYLFRFFHISQYFSFIGSLLTVMTGNLSYILPIISKQYNFFSKSNIFMSDQPFDQSFNPFNLLAYAIFINLVILLLMWEKKPTFKLLLLITMIVSVLCGIKIYAGLLICIGIGTLFMIKIFQKQFRLYYLLPLLLIYPVINIIKGKNFSILAFNPGWLLTKMIEDQDRLALNDMALKEQFYKNTGNLLRYWQIKIEQLSIYFIGNLNIRILSIFIILKNLWRKYFSINGFIVFLALILFAFIIPLLFNQTRNSYDSIQFTPYGLLLCSVLLILLIDYLSYKLNKVIFSIAIICLFLIGVPTNIAIANSNINSIPYIIPKNEVLALEFINKVSDSGSIILTNMDNNKMVYMYVPFISQRSTFLSGTTLMQQLGIDTTNREKQINDFFTIDDTNEIGIEEKIDFLKANKIKYIYLSNEGLNKRGLMENLDLSEIYSTENILIYEIE